MNIFNYDKVPLSHKYRANTLEEFLGQEKIKKIIKPFIEKNKMISCIFYGPSGTGKTTLAKIIANSLGYKYVYLNAIKSSKIEVKEILENTNNSIEKTLIFLDEIHRFNKLQQDTFLEDLENGNIILIGATTENPYYSLNKALISRLLVFKFEKLSNEDIYKLLVKISKNEEIPIRDEVLNLLKEISDGDARVAINFLETIIGADFLNKSIEELKDILNINIFADRYDTISAMIKSIRGSDPDAAIYWLSRLLLGGEDPMYIARRLVILASEDIGLANPDAITLAVSTMTGVSEIGMPESRILLSECVIYLSLSPKSNTVYNAINSAFEEIENNGAQDVPFHLTKAGSKEYIYPHNYKNNYIEQKYINKKIKLYIPGENKFEKRMSEIWDKIRKEDF